MNLDEDEVAEHLNKWQNILRLRDWDIMIKIIKSKWRKSGDIKIDLEDKKAVLLLNSAPKCENLEELIIHELLHLKLYGMDQMIEDLLSIVYGKKEKKEAFEELCTATDPKVDLVTIGCPHCTLQEIMDVAQLLGGRRVHKDVRLLVGTDAVTRLLAKRIGLVDIIEEAGGFVTADMCPNGVRLQPRIRATSSAGAAGVGAYSGTRVNWFGTTKDCIEAAVKGRWEGR